MLSELSLKKKAFKNDFVLFLLKFMEFIAAINSTLGHFSIS